MLSKYKDISAFITKDGSTIRELMHPDTHGNHGQSLAEATIPENTETVLHLHQKSEEIYHITQGTGEMTLGNKCFTVNVGDTICIPPDTAHRIRNNGNTPLKFLCVCSPAYSHADTILLA